MADLLEIRHEDDDLSEYTATAGADIETSAASALAGTNYGLSLLLDDVTASYGYKTISLTTNDLRIRIYIDPNSPSMADNDWMTILRVTSDTPVGPRLLECRFRYDDPDLGIQTRSFVDTGSLDDTALATITDEPHYIEFHVERAASNVSGDGRLRTWIDGALQNTISNLDNYDDFPDAERIYFGDVVGINATTTGTFYMDEFKANDDGGEIGPVAAAGGQPMNLRGITVPHSRQWQPRPFS